MLRLHHLAQFLHDLRILGGDVGGLERVVGEIVEFDIPEGRVLLARGGAEVLADRFPVADADALLAAVAGGFAVEERAGFLFAAEQRRGEASPFLRTHPPLYCPAYG
ncbi:MAG: hypothetical protein ACHRHE_18785 [Tepidisphaerales bacterium]